MSSAPAAEVIEVGVALRDADIASDAGRLHHLLDGILAAGLDHVVVGDHVTFKGGQGTDGLVLAAALLGAHPAARVETGVYLLPLRQPVVVARALATISSIAPGRFAFGVGIGGDDRAEFAACGVDPATRGARTDEALTLVRSLLAGATVSHDGRFFSVRDVCIRPTPEPAIPVLVGGRADAAIVRVGRHGDGWVAIWVSPERFADGVTRAAEVAADAGRDVVRWRHTLTAWCGFGDDPTAGRARLAPVMEDLYQVPFERFERYACVGRAEDVAASLLPFVAAGCRRFNLIVAGHSVDEWVDAAGHVASLLRAHGRKYCQ